MRPIVPEPPSDSVWLPSAAPVRVIDPEFVRPVPDRSVYVLPAAVTPPTLSTLLSPEIDTGPVESIPLVAEASVIVA